jgi:RNA polymerase sigma-70 factor (ECF subfamily)
MTLDDGDLEQIVEVAQGGSGTLLQLVERLPRDEQAAIRSRVLDERSYSEIATQLKCSEMVVRKRVSRGLARIRQQLKETESA